MLAMRRETVIEIEVREWNFRGGGIESGRERGEEESGEWKGGEREGERRVSEGGRQREGPTEHCLPSSPHPSVVMVVMLQYRVMKDTGNVSSCRHLLLKITVLFLSSFNFHSLTSIA